MTRFLRAATVLAAFALLGCSQQEEVAMPDPFTLDAQAIGRYCGMNVLEHDGPKGQIILTRIPEPIWFSSARDAVAFTMLPDEPKNIAAIYVSDMATATSWEQPGADNWIDAKNAFFVLGSRQRGGMGTSETVPFSTEEAARAFAATNGGKVVRFDDIPLDYVLGDSDEEPDDDAVGAIAPHVGH
jgi:copper chaperone NosL